MAENEIPEEPAVNAPAETTAAAEPAPAATTAPVAPVAPVAPRLRDHLFTFRSVIAVGVATLLIGGAGGAAVVALVEDGNDGPRMVQFDGPGRSGDGPQFRNGPGGGSGFAPPDAPGSAG